MKIKVCGMTGIEQMRELEALEVDYAGLIFYPGSKRYALPALNGHAGAVRTLGLRKVGVFVNAGREHILETVERFGLSAVQLHGEEQPELCRSLMKEVEVVKAIRVGTGTDLPAQVAAYRDAGHYLLFDTDTAGYGGSGQKFNWALIQAADVPLPFFLSGGIGPEDVTELALFAHPMLHAVDVNSRFEAAPGRKDLQAVTSFVNAIKATTWKK